MQFRKNLLISTGMNLIKYELLFVALSEIKVKRNFREKLNYNKKIPLKISGIEKINVDVDISQEVGNLLFPVHCHSTGNIFSYIFMFL